MSQKTRIVIIGASYAGIGLAQALLKAITNIHVVIINPSDKFFFNIASPRILAKSTSFKSDQYLLPIVKAFAHAPAGAFEFIQGHAVDINPDSKTANVSNKGNVAFDYLVIASGSSTASSMGHGSTLAPFKPTGDKDLEASIKAAQHEIARAKTVVIGGAGAVGVEFAGELAEAFKGRKIDIALVSSTWHVLPALKKAGSERAEEILAQKGVKLVRGRKVLRSTQDLTSRKWKIDLDDGQTMGADVYISTTGVFPNNKFIPSQYLDSKGWVSVDSEMRVKGSTAVYAIGDITSYSARLMLKVQEQIPVVACNLKNDILGQGKRKRYTPDDKVMMIVPVGSSNGTGQMFGMVPWGKMVAMIKGKDFFVSKAKNMIGMK
ncbi:hypothetical protein Asppvi_005395 [Aspergillus pseudoviridinutans]|uniref:FAD/NAD(P)-binding domain-containing protein n=1 Tax=Aspergillus pseudoviridinutans TaxID=1517512 RepID=A0A9P3B865_9EURO|nr:uncharacterized protein Asppvi_005395 [Aspergillus pseudoviridinutans]GIJ86506.1 hypothetical protein Asppvi_005395 [Aspergillus pseudoviridinutans]